MSRRYSRPVGPYIIDGSSPQAKGLVFVLPLFEVFLLDRIGKIVPSVTGTPGIAYDVDRASWAFSGTSQYLSFSYTPLTAVPLTLMAWVRPGQVSSSRSILSLCASANTTNFFNLGLLGTGPNFRFQSGDGTTSSASSTNTSLAIDNWYHVTGVSAATNSRACYTNGTAKGTQASTRSPTGINQFNVAALGGSGFTVNWNGQIADVRLYNRAMTDDEVAEAYSNPWDLYKPYYKIWVVPPLTGVKTIIPSGIASTLTLGTATLAQVISPSGLASGGAFGTPALKQNIVASGIASGQALGTVTAAVQPVRVIPSGLVSGMSLGAVTLTGKYTITATGIAETSAIGTPQINKALKPTGIASGGIVGSLKLNLAFPLPALASGLAFGSATFAKGSVSISVTGIASGEAWGTAFFTVSAQVLTLTGLDSDEAFPDSILSFRLPFTGMGSAEAFGTLTTILYVIPSGVGTGEQEGDALVRHIKAIQPLGMTSGQATGAPTLLPQPVTVTLTTGIGTGEAFGSLNIKLRLLASELVSEEAEGGPQVNLVIQPDTGRDEVFATGVAVIAKTIIVTGLEVIGAFGSTRAIPSTYRLPASSVPSDFIVGDIVIRKGYSITATTLVSGLAFGVASILRGAVQITVTGILTSSELGDNTLNFRLRMAGVTSDLTIPNPSSGQPIGPVAIDTGEAFGIGLLTLNILVSGLDSDLVIPEPIQKPGAQNVLITGLASEFAGNTVNFLFAVTPTGIGTGEAFGTILWRLRFTVPAIASGETVPVAGVGFLVAPLGLDSEFAEGILSIRKPATVRVGGLESDFTLPVQIVFPDKVTIDPSGLDSLFSSTGQAFTLRLPLTGKESDFTLGDLAVTRTITLRLAGVETALVVGGLTVARGTVTLTLSGLDSSLSIGSAMLNLQLSVTGLASTEAIPSITLAVTIYVTGIGTVLGIGDVTWALFLLAGGIPSDLAIGAIAFPLAIFAFAIDSLEAFGTGNLTTSFTIAAVGFSLEREWGLPFLFFRIFLVGVESFGEVGSAGVGNAILPLGLESLEAIGIAGIGWWLPLPSLDSELTIGDPLLLPQPVTVDVAGLASSSALGEYNVARGINPQGMPSAFASGGVLFWVFASQLRGFRVKAEQRSWTVAVDKRFYSVKGSD